MPPFFSMKTTLKYEGALRTDVVTDAHDANRGIIVTKQDVSGVLRNVRAMKENEKLKKQDLRPVAEVPMVIVEKAMQEGWYNDPAAWKRWLNDPDNKAFRVWEGKV